MPTRTPLITSETCDPIVVTVAGGGRGGDREGEEDGEMDCWDEEDDDDDKDGSLEVDTEEEDKDDFLLISQNSKKAYVNGL